MRYLHLALLSCLLNVFSSDSVLEFPSSAPTTILKSVMTHPTTTKDVTPEVTNILYQSKDGGQTWQDISHGLPENEQPEVFLQESRKFICALKMYCIAVKVI
jgi:hypothetical protein